MVGRRGDLDDLVVLGVQLEVAADTAVGADRAGDVLILGAPVIDLTKVVLGEKVLDGVAASKTLSHRSYYHWRSFATAFRGHLFIASSIPNPDITALGLLLVIDGSQSSIITGLMKDGAAGAHLNNMITLRASQWLGGRERTHNRPFAPAGGSAGAHLTNSSALSAGRPFKRHLLGNVSTFGGK